MGDERHRLADVLDALSPFIEQADHLRGFSVTYAPERHGSAIVDPDVVEVRIRYPTRHPEDADKCRGMLQGNGFDVERGKRGGQSDLIIYLRVPLAGPEDRGGEQRVASEGEKATF